MPAYSLGWTSKPRLYQWMACCSISMSVYSLSTNLSLQIRPHRQMMSGTCKNETCGASAESYLGKSLNCFKSSVADPDPNPDPHLFGPPGSGSTSQEVWIRIRIRLLLWIRIRILLSSCKNSKKNLDSYYFVTLFDFLSLKNDVNVPSKSNKQKNCVKKFVFCWHLEDL
jgi:hypothetical protein